MKIKKTKTAVNLFDDWALSGKDQSMEKGHAHSVNKMIEIISNMKNRYCVFNG